MLEKIIIFLVFLAPLIFFHELGHFLFARLFGVRVETFSIGFGPKLLKFIKGDTTYTVSLIPLGGYIKMFGDDPTSKDELTDEEKKYAFTHKGKWARFWIVFGGPLANFILAYVLTVGLLMTGEKVPEVKVGSIPTSSSLYEMGFQPADKLKKVNGEEILGLTDFAMKTDGKHIDTITVERNGINQKVVVDQNPKPFLDEFLKYPQIFRLPIVVNNLGEKFVLARDAKVDWGLSLEWLGQSKGEINLTLYPIAKAEKTPNGYEVFEDRGSVLNLELTQDKAFFSQLRENGFFPLDLQVKSIVMKSPADLGGIRANDIIISVADQKVESFTDIRNLVQDSKKNIPVAITFIREGVEERVRIIPNIRQEGEQEIKTIGIYSATEIIPMTYLESRPKGIFHSLGLGLSRTWEMIVATVNGFAKLISGDVPLNSIGGPLAIGKVASDSYNVSLSYFLGLMALVSVNLGIINLFPIPVLDGGHILFIGLEIVNRGPLSRRKMEIAQQFGFSILLILIVAALANDFSRFF